MASEQPALPWGHRMLALGVALFLAWVVFSALWIAVVDRRDFVALFGGFQIVIPAFCIVPYLTLITGKPFPELLVPRRK